MSIEGIKSAGMSFQASTSNNVAKQNTESVADIVEAKAVAEEASARTTNIDVKKDGSADNNARPDDNRASVDAIKKAVEELNKTSTNNTVQFGVHEQTNRMTIKILDKDTRKVVKEFPAEKSLDLIAKAMEMAGILIDEKR